MKLKNACPVCQQFSCLFGASRWGHYRVILLAVIEALAVVGFALLVAGVLR